MTYLVPDSTIALIEARADEARKNRVMSHEVVEELKKCGFFKMFLPKQWGGLEARPQEFFREQIRIAEADMSHAWASGIIAIHAYQIAMMDQKAQETVYGRRGVQRCSKEKEAEGQTAADSAFHQHCRETNNDTMQLEFESCRGRHR